MASQTIRPDFPFMDIRVTYLAVGGQAGELQTSMTRPAFNFGVRSRQVETGGRVRKLCIAEHLP